MPIPKGNSSKDSQYLARIKAAIADEKEHPRHHGVLMQAHHIISGKGMKSSGLGKKLEKFGYDINLLPNLVFLPCTLQGACHLGVQPHRGNHDFSIDQDDYEDDREPPNYHRSVTERLQALDLPMSKECTPATSKKVIDALDGLSRRMLRTIINNPAELPLTRLFGHFGPGAGGCGGVDSVRAHTSGKVCAVHRNHYWEAGSKRKPQGPGQAFEKITYQPTEPFKFKVGQ